MLPHILKYLPLLVLLVSAAAVDLRERRIPNWLTLLMIVSGIGQSFFYASGITPLRAVVGVMAGAAIPFVLFAIGALGAGDVKLMAGIGAWLGPAPVLVVLVLEKIIGMMIVLAQAAAQGKTRVLLDNSAVVALNLCHIRQVGIEHASRTGQSFRSIERPLPFAVPAFIAVVLVLVGTGLR